MNLRTIAIEPILSTATLAAYISSVVWITMRMEHASGGDSIAGPTGFLLLFVLSALVSGVLTLGMPLYVLFGERKPKRAILSLSLHIASLGAAILIFLSFALGSN